MNPQSTAADAPAPSDPIGNIYLVVPTQLPGGMSRMVSYLHRTWNRAEAPITIIDSYGPGSKAIMPFYFLAALVRVFSAAVRGRIGLLHIHMSERLSVVRKGILVYLGSAFGIPIVLHLHGSELVEYCRSRSPGGLARIRRMLAKVDAVVALGTYWRHFVCHELGVDCAKVAVLHNAVPGPERVPERPERVTCRILFLGVVSDRKGMPVLLRALAQPALAQLDWQMDVAGDGEVGFFRAEADRLGIGTRVLFHGWVDERKARELLGSSDVLALPSRNEGLPMSIIEGMAYGLAVVATPVGSIPDAITHETTGLLVPVGDVEALASALARLVSDSRFRQELGQRARARYLERFEISAFNAALLDIFRHAKLGLPAPESSASPGEGADTEPRPVPNQTA